MKKLTNDIEKAIKQLKSDWIPVNERLPEKSDVYLATFLEEGESVEE